MSERKAGQEKTNNMEVQDEYRNKGTIRGKGRMNRGKDVHRKGMNVYG
jgi:hypothetical protein